MEFPSSFVPFLGCALMGLVCFALMHRSHTADSSTPPPAQPPADADLRAEVERLRAEVAELRQVARVDVDTEAP